VQLFSDAKFNCLMWWSAIIPWCHSCHSNHTRYSHPISNLILHIAKTYRYVVFFS